MLFAPHPQGISPLTEQVAKSPYLLKRKAAGNSTQLIELRSGVGGRVIAADCRRAMQRTLKRGRKPKAETSAKEMPPGQELVE